MPFKWNARFEMNHETVDAEHKYLFECANRILELEQMPQHFTEFKKLVKELYDYTQHHFTHEEEIMDQHKFPLLILHKRLHNMIVIEMNKYLTSARKPSVLMNQFKSLAEKWVVQHIINEDMKFKHYVDNLNRGKPQLLSSIV